MKLADLSLLSLNVRKAITNRCNRICLENTHDNNGEIRRFQSFVHNCASDKRNNFRIVVASLRFASRSVTRQKQSVATTQTRYS